MIAWLCGAWLRWGRRGAWLRPALGRRPTFPVRGESRWRLRPGALLGTLAGMCLGGCAAGSAVPLAESLKVRVLEAPPELAWEAAVGAVRRVGLTIRRADRERGTIATDLVHTAGVPVLADGLLGSRMERGRDVRYRLTLTGRALGPDRTEVRLAVEYQYWNLGMRGWYGTTSDGSVERAFWVQLEESLETARGIAASRELPATDR